MAKANQPEDVFKLIDMRGPDECWPWLGPSGGRDRDPRPYFTCGGVRWIAYRLVYTLVHGVTLRRDQLLLHSCDKGAMPPTGVGCCNPHHVSIGTEKQNADDMTSRQRHGLPHSVVKAIRRLIESGRTQEQIAELYGVSRETISAIKNERVYTHITHEDALDNTPKV